MSETKQATDEEIIEHNRVCDNCNGTAYFKAWHGGKYCKKHFIQNTKYGIEETFEIALERCELINTY